MLTKSHSLRAPPRAQPERVIAQSLIEDRSLGELRPQETFPPSLHFQPSQEEVGTGVISAREQPGLAQGLERWCHLRLPLPDAVWPLAIFPRGASRCYLGSFRPQGRAGIFLVRKWVFSKGLMVEIGGLFAGEGVGGWGHGR